MAADPFVYLLLSVPDFEAATAAGVWDPPSRAAEGFVHASPIDQLVRVANKHYRAHTELRVVALRADRLTAELRWEPAAGGLYPHVYGPVNMDAAERVGEMHKGDDGLFGPPSLPGQ